MTSKHYKRPNTTNVRLSKMQMERLREERDHLIMTALESGYYRDSEVAWMFNITSQLISDIKQRYERRHRSTSTAGKS